MKNILVAISVASLVGGSVASAAVRAESQGRSEKTHYQYATVLSAKPIKEIFVRSEPQQECWQEPVVEHHRNQLALRLAISLGTVSKIKKWVQWQERCWAHPLGTI